MATSGQRATAAAASGVVRLDGLRPRRLRWLWREHIAAGMIAALAGRPGQGKSLLALHIAAELSRRAAVLVSSSEDPLAEQAVPRGLAAVAAAGGNPGRIYFERGRLPALPAGLERWAARIAELDLRLIVADPIASHLTPHLGDDQAVCRALDPLAQLCAETGCAVLALAHTIKRPPRQAEPLAAIGGAAGGLAGQARAVYLFAAQPATTGGCWRKPSATSPPPAPASASNSTSASSAAASRRRCCCATPAARSSTPTHCSTPPDSASRSPASRPRPPQTGSSTTCTPPARPTNARKPKSRRRQTTRPHNTHTAPRRRQHPNRHPQQRPQPKLATTRPHRRTQTPPTRPLNAPPSSAPTHQTPALVAFEPLQRSGALP